MIYFQTYEKYFKTFFHFYKCPKYDTARHMEPAIAAILKQIFGSHKGGNTYLKRKLVVSEFFKEGAGGFL